VSVRIAVVDYGMGNRRSVQKALEHVGATAEITRDHDGVRSADGVVVPGLGMQLLFERSVEIEPTPGLGLIGGDVTPLRAPGLRVPHIGWNEVTLQRSSRLTDALGREQLPFYHVHSLAARPSDPADVVGSTEYGERFATVVQRGSVYGVQFHPEKSSADGLRMLQAFTAVCAPATATAH
jgi:glutamine amidotransferase